MFVLSESPKSLAELVRHPNDKLMTHKLAGSYSWRRLPTREVSGVTRACLDTPCAGRHQLHISSTNPPTSEANVFYFSPFLGESP